MQAGAAIGNGGSSRGVGGDNRPNVVLCLVDDLGYSDFGCYGSEIRTPVVDSLARSGVRFSQLYNSARCCPSRAALLTGLHPHQAGVGHMVWAGPSAAYAGYLNASCTTIPEVLGAHGYQTFMSGKWHVGGNYDALSPSAWRPGDDGFPTPLQRGFDHFYGTLTGSGSYYQPATLMAEDRFIEQMDPDWYYTDAIADEAIDMLKGRDDARPFFMYLAFTAPHWPLHARAETIESYRDVYRSGWDELRRDRYDRLVASGMVSEKWALSPRDGDAWPWEAAASTDWESYRMATYAAQVEHLDAALGRVVEHLRAEGTLDNTLLLVLSDNGGCAELLREDVVPDDTWPSSVPLVTVDGREVAVGNRMDVLPGGPDTFASYDTCWANLSNAPFRRFKRWVHEGGISTPFIAHWPDRVSGGNIVHSPAHITDLMPTILEATGATYPAERAGKVLPSLAGKSLVGAFTGPGGVPEEREICLEHEGHRAIRQGDWKLVSVRSGEWELYNLEEDRTELDDLAEGDRARVEQMGSRWFEWACSVGADTSVFEDVDMIESNYVGISPELRRQYWLH
ncbi:MAG: arylsulfatase [Acidimicrobiales bacterium]